MTPPKYLNNEPFIKFAMGIFKPRSVQELTEFITRNKNFVVIGNKSNSLIISKRKKLVNLSKLSYIKVIKNNIVVSSGVSLEHLLKVLTEKNLSGVEFLAGIPGTVGGAVFMNAGAFNGEIGDFVTKIKVLNPKTKKIKILSKKDLRFGYRKSNIKDIVLEAELKLKKGNKKEIFKKIRDYQKIRNKKFPKGKSWGSTFKSPPGFFAGKLIEACGLKGYRIGRAEISKKHANFIIQKGDNPNDVLRLMKLMQKQVYKKFKIKLEPEVKII